MDKTINMTPAAPTRPAIYYPESDGQPMGETDFHINAIIYLREALRHFFRLAENIYVAANMLFYYEEGDTTAVKSPDVFVVKGVAKHLRRIYKLWEEGVAPCTIFEVTSRGTRLEDLGTKKALYEMIGVREYFLFDPLDEYLKPRLQGFRLAKGIYQPLALSKDGVLRSEELGLILRPEGILLRIVDPISGEAVPTAGEALIRAETEAVRAQAEAARAERAEAELARLRAELERLRRQTGVGGQ